jgi:hypothetical protein
MKSCVTARVGFFISPRLDNIWPASNLSGWVGISWQTVSPQDLVKISQKYRMRTIRYGLIPYSSTKVLMFHRKSSCCVKVDQLMVLVFSLEPLYGIKAALYKMPKVLIWDYRQGIWGHHDENCIRKLISKLTWWICYSMPVTMSLTGVYIVYPCLCQCPCSCSFLFVFIFIFIFMFMPFRSFNSLYITSKNPRYRSLGSTIYRIMLACPRWWNQFDLCSSCDGFPLNNKKFLPVI